MELLDEENEIGGGGRGVSGGVRATTASSSSFAAAGGGGLNKIELSKQMVGIAEQLSRKTHFSTNEVLSLFVMYQKVTAASHGKMDRLRFREVMHTTFDITDDVMLDRAFRVFDTNNDGVVDEKEWTFGLSTILKGSLDELITFCYAVYDINGDRALAREELYHCLKNCLIRTAGIEEDIEESIKDIVEIALKKLDLDRNGTITFADYQGAVRGDKLLLLTCGNCLPSTRAKTHFLHSFQQDFQIPFKTVNQLMRAQQKLKGK